MQSRKRLAFWCALGGLALLALGVNASRLGAAFHRWQLQRLSLPQLEQEAQAHPTDAETRYQLGLRYAHASRYHDATREFLAVVQQEPARPEVFNDLGVTYLLQERYYEALVSFQGALTARPEFAAAQANLGRLHLATKMPFTATRELEQAARLAPHDVRTLCDLGEAYQATLNLKAAEQTYRRALAVDPKDPAAHLGLGKTCFSLTRYQEAEREMKAALALDPKNGAALQGLGRVRLQTAVSPKDLEAARDLLQQAAKLEPNEPEIEYDLGRVALRLEQPQEALKHLERALTLSPQHPGALHELARALRAAGNTAAADRADFVFREQALGSREESRLEDQIRQTPNDAESKVRLAQIYLQTGKNGLAALLCRQLQETAPNHPRLPALLQELNRRRVEFNSPPPAVALEGRQK
jgi:Flp pilus assembly protein TadD